MANMSDAYGSMTLKGKWTPRLIENLNRITQEIWGCWFYNIVLDPYDPKEPIGEQCSSFNGIGRWAFCTNLKNLGQWTLADIPDHPDLAGVFAELIRGMKKNNLTLEVEYFDEEPGCLVLYTETSEIFSNGETFEYKEISYQEYDYNWVNYIDVTGDEECFYELVKNVCEKIGIDSNEDIELWLKNNSYPHCSELGYLDDDKQKEFKLLFAPKVA